jgi:hypothetical protein
MTCDHCLKTPSLDRGIVRELQRFAGAAARVMRSALASLAQLG